MNTLDINQIWEQALQELFIIEETRSPLAKVYLKYLVPISLNDSQIVFAVRLLQAKLWIENRYLSYIDQVISSLLNDSREIIIIVDDNAGLAAIEQNPSSKITQQFSVVQPLQEIQASSHTHPYILHEAQSEANKISSFTQEPLVETVVKSTGLSSVFATENHSQKQRPVETGSRFTFSNYVMGESNQLAFKTSQRVAEGPGQYFNPLFIHGRSGLGKTHLLLAIKNYISTYLPEKRVVYAPTTEFVNDFTNAIAVDRDLTSFKRKYHTCDVLLVDDVQILEGKEGTTDALFEIFNMFIESKKQIVLSADREPAEINLDERFTSRFANGITVDIQPPNYEMKTAILKNYKRYYCDYLNISEVPFSDEAMQQIVELSGSNIRELEGAISNLIVFASYRPDSQKLIPVSSDDVENVLGNSFFHKNTRRVDSNMIIDAVESYFKVSRAELLSEKRSKNISHPRQVAMYLIRRYTDMSYPEIGDSFNKDHTSVMYADKNIQKKIVEEVSVKIEVERIAEILTT